MKRLFAAVSIFFCFEIGLFLIIIPWSELWEGNYFLQYIPALRFAVIHPIFRSAVSILGVFDLLIGFSELRYLVRLLRGNPVVGAIDSHE